jgi:hypothetical protein
MKALLVATAAIEFGAGLALLCIPSGAAQLLFGASLDTSAAVTMARIGGLGLLTLGIMSWLARNETGAARGIVQAMVIYNAGAAGVFVYAGAAPGLHGMLLWPAAGLHAGMTAWCLLRLAAKD